MHLGGQSLAWQVRRVYKVWHSAVLLLVDAQRKIVVGTAGSGRGVEKGDPCAYVSFTAFTVDANFGSRARMRSVVADAVPSFASTFASSSSSPPSSSAVTADSSRHALNRAEGTLSFDLLASAPTRRLRVLWLENRLECGLWSYYCELRDAMAQLHELCTPSPSRTCLGEGFAPDVAIAGPRFSINIPTPNETLGFARSRLNQLPLLIIVRHPSALPHCRICCGARTSRLSLHASRHASRLTFAVLRASPAAKQAVHAQGLAGDRGQPGRQARMGQGRRCRGRLHLDPSRQEP